MKTLTLALALLVALTFVPSMTLADGSGCGDDVKPACQSSCQQASMFACANPCPIAKKASACRSIGCESQFSSSQRRGYVVARLNSALAQF